MRNLISENANCARHRARQSPKRSNFRQYETTRSRSRLSLPVTPAPQDTDESRYPPRVIPQSEKTLTTPAGTPPVDSDTPPRNTYNSQFPQPRSPRRQNRERSKKSPSTLHKIAKLIDQVITKHNPPGQTKAILNEVLDLVKKGGEGEKDSEPHVPINAVETLHERIRAHLATVHSDLDAKLSILNSNQIKLLASTEFLGKTTETLRSTTRDLESNVVKVNDTMDKLATTTLSCRDPILVNPVTPSTVDRTSTPKVLNNADRRARQILIGYVTWLGQKRLAHSNALLPWLSTRVRCVMCVHRQH